MSAIPLLTLAAYATGLLLTLVLAAFLTPASWWRRLNARALAVTVAGTWAAGSLLAALLPAHAGATASSARTATAAAPQRSYLVFRALNLRSGAGTSARRIVVVPAGAEVAATGAREGDWWQVRATIEGRKVTGWASSLWLRRADEEPARR
ncbi:SH3 domain-containing protein [Massilia cavernae]|uniref:SH3 domain-containing protein n=1 Tax=Massilia cavernae TaxID=2320864 RepID=A0A418Y173_9BURK|nr:SH3 domain-containing protein [Massilia cavernae]RJG19182.1 SH3 domain-containing protein [Massilia cavernae]